MRNSETMLRVYEELAGRFATQNELRFRDHCLVLAADTALSSDRPQEADRLRMRLLQVNPHHLLRPFASMGEAMKAPDVQEYVADLRRQWPPEFVQKLYLSGGDPPADVETPPPARRTEVPRWTEPGAKDEKPGVRAAPAKTVPPPPTPALELPAPAPRRPIAAAPKARPAPPVPAPPRAVAPVEVPLPAPSAGRVGPWLATMLLMLGIAGAVALFLLAFVWPLLD